MDVLLDTHAFLWLAAREEMVPEEVRARLGDPEVGLYLSVASVWEMAIKRSLGKLETHVALGELVKSQCEAMNVATLVVSTGHALAVEDLPFHHRDPFDRLLVAQAISEDLALASADEILDRYPVERVW